MEVVVKVSPHHTSGLLNGEQVNPWRRNDIGGVQPVEQCQHVLHFIEKTSRAVIIAGLAAILSEDMSARTDGAVTTGDSGQAVACPGRGVTAMTL